MSFKDFLALFLPSTLDNLKEKYRTTGKIDTACPDQLHKEPLHDKIHTI